jgi:hypothetical protein
VLAAGRATIELIDRDQAALIDQVEVGERVAGPVRLAFQVPDTQAMTPLQRSPCHSQWDAVDVLSDPG